MRPVDQSQVVRVVPGKRRDILSQRFGILSTKHAEQDRIGRVRRLLAFECVPNDLGAEAVEFDLDEIEWLAAHGEYPKPVGIVGSHRPVDPRAVLLHALLPGAFTLQVHGDGLCALSGGRDPRARVEAVLGRDVLWSACPNDPAAIATLARSEEGSLLIPGLGLYLSGASQADLVAQAELLEDRAAVSLAGTNRNAMSALMPGRKSRESAGPSRTPESGPPSGDSENLMVSIRGLLSTPDRVLFSISGDWAGYAERDIERLLAAAKEVESDAAGDAIFLVRDLETARADLARLPDVGATQTVDTGNGSPSLGPVRVGALFMLGVGLIGVGGDETEAGFNLRAAAHRLAIATWLLGEPPLSGEGLSVQAPASGQPVLDDEVSIEAVRGGRRNGPGPLTGRAFIVTGAASGIGRDIARHLSLLGASLSLADVNGQALGAVADELVRSGIEPLTISGDLTDEAVVDRLVGSTVGRFGGIDGAVLNVGIALPGEIAKLSAADWRRSLEVNATSHFLLVKRLLPVLRGQGIGGSLVFIGSKNMFSPGAGFGAYSASKGALAQLARIVAIEGGPAGIRSNIVNPDNVFDGSQLWSPELRAQRAAVYGIRPEDLETYYTQRNLLKVPISGHDVAKGVAFLLSDDARRTTACVLTVDGGVPGVFPR
jgi:NAD(P)-dependent dehydrogenase (short-subunit alcohol dehydrogenase family)